MLIKHVCAGVLGSLFAGIAHLPRGVILTDFAHLVFHSSLPRVPASRISEIVGEKAYSRFNPNLYVAFSR